MYVYVNPADQFLLRLRALAFLVGPHFPNPILETVQLEATKDGRGVLRATNGADKAEVEVPLLTVVRPGTVQLPTFVVLRALADTASSWSKVEIEELPPVDAFSFQADPKAPSRKVVLRTPRPRQSSVTLPTWNPDDFPLITPAEFAKAIEINAWQFRCLLTPAATCVATTDDRDSIRDDGCAFEFGDVALDGIPTDNGRCRAASPSNGTGTTLIAPPTDAVAEAKRLLALAVPAQVRKVLAAILDTMEEDTVLTLGFTASEGLFQVQGPGVLFLAKLRDGRFALPAANRLEHQSVNHQEPTQEMPSVVENASSTELHSPRTLTMPAKKNSEEHKDRPVRVIRLKNIRGNVWANRLPSGQVVYNVTIDRLWKQDDQVEGGEVIKSGEWHQSQSYGRDDLLLVAKVADLCHTWIFQRAQDESRGRDF